MSNPRRFLALLGGALSIAQPAAAQSRTAIDLVTHSEVTIDRPAAEVWPLIVDPASWKKGLSVWHHSGPSGALGEIQAAGNPADKATVAFFLENVEWVPNRRRTIKLFLPTGALIGFATWTLDQKGRATTVGYDVYSETLVEPGMTPAQLREAQRSGAATNQARFDEELRELKRLVETRR